jgi:hypothetical protein
MNKKADRSFIGILGNIASLVLSLLCLASCGTPTPEEMASLAAKGYYDHLIHGEYEQFLEGVDQSELARIMISGGTASYSAQLLDNYRQFIADQQESHGSIREVRIVQAHTDSLQKYINVFLTLCFGDSTNEEIVVPMVERKGHWRMR